MFDSGRVCGVFQNRRTSTSRQLFPVQRKERSSGSPPAVLQHWATRFHVIKKLQFTSLWSVSILPNSQFEFIRYRLSHSKAERRPEELRRAGSHFIFVND